MLTLGETIDELEDLSDVLERFLARFVSQWGIKVSFEHPDKPVMVTKKVGDQVLRILGAEVQAIASENGGIAGRFEADRFDIYCRHNDDYRAMYERLQDTLSGLALFLGGSSLALCVLLVQLLDEDAAGLVHRIGNVSVKNGLEVLASSHDFSFLRFMRLR